MTANIFGSTLKAVKTNEKYIDSKFTVLTKSLDAKLDKFGGVITGSISMNGNRIHDLLDPSDVMDASNKSYVDLQFNKLSRQINSKLDLDGDVMHGNIDMNGNMITNIHNPVHDGDAVNKKYADEKTNRMYSLSMIGLVPHLSANIDKTGYVVTASHELGDNSAYKVFSPRNGQWRAGSNGLIDFSIEIRCLKPVKIYMFSIKPADNTKFIRWQMQGKMQTTDWKTLPFTLRPIDNVQNFEIDPNLAEEYLFYRLLIQEAESLANNPGISHWQLFTVNPIYI